MTDAPSLLLRGGGLGDLILTLPAAHLIRRLRPRATLSLAGDPRWSPLVLAPRGPFDDASDLTSAAWGRRLDGAGDAPAHFSRYGLVASTVPDAAQQLARSLAAAGFRTPAPGQPLPERAWIPLPWPPSGTHASAALAAPLAALLPGTPLPAPRLQPTAADLAEARDAGLPSRAIVLHPGSGGTRKNLPLGKWIAVGRAIPARDHARLVWLCGPAEIERGTAATLAAAAPPGRLLLHPPLPSLLALLAQAAAFAGHDSGTAHLAAASGCPCFLAFTSTDPALWAPLGTADVGLLQADFDPNATARLLAGRT